MSRFIRAASMAFFISPDPENTADIGTKSISTECANARAIVVLPQPGGPHNIKFDNLWLSTIRRINPFSPNKFCCPTTSSMVAGRIISASGLVSFFIII